MTITDTIKQSIQTERLPHALLLVGPNHDELCTLALYLAAAYNCEGALASRPCPGGQDTACLPCRKTCGHNHPDVITLDCTAGTVHIEEIRQLHNSLPVLPNEGRRKVYLIYGAHLLTPVCQNGLLAALEEPPKAVAFVLTCERPDALLPTVRSRLTRWDRETSKDEDILDPALLKSGESILEAFDKRDEMRLLLAAQSCDTLSRDQTSQILDLVRRGLLTRAGVSNPSEGEKFLTAAAALGTLQETLTRNAGLGHLYGAMASHLSAVFTRSAH